MVDYPGDELHPSGNQNAAETNQTGGQLRLEEAVPLISSHFVPFPDIIPVLYSYFVPASSATEKDVSKDVTLSKLDSGGRLVPPVAHKP